MTSTDPDLTNVIESSEGRISRVRHHGQFIWVKRREKLTLRMRMQKGASASAFESERAALHKLADMGAPVAEIVAEGPTFFATKDSGTPLDHLLRDSARSGADHSREFSDAARSLAGLHAQHITHGHPRIKDICWRDGKITFIDLERYRDSLNTPFGHARDVVTFFFSGLAVAGRSMPELETARDVYRSHDTAGIWTGARDLCRRMKFMDWLSKPLQFRREGKAREFKAIPLTLAFFDLR